ncbi:MAG: hypothetical protein PUC25_02320, partial [Prevotellaceae bacterium]|nr:hypothetical protein [Prevotellaceae bacterium]
MENRTEREKGNGMVAVGCLFVPDSTLAPYSASTGAESVSTGAESREEREERLWREEMEAAGLSGEMEENLAAENDGDSITVTMLPKSNAPTEPAPGMDALTRLWGMTTELWYDYKRGKRLWGKLR